ncbi:hypothetical protein [Microbacterium paulum]
MRRSTERASSGLLAVLAATAIAGASGYLIQLLAARFLVGAHDYLSFSVFWSTLYLIGSAVGGMQQEVARATHPLPTGRTAEEGPRTLRGFTLVGALIVLSISLVVGLLVAPTAFAGSSAGMAVALAVGLVGYVATSVVTGLFYGLGRLGSVATLIIVDATLRAVAVVAAFAVGAPPDVVAFAVAVPFGVAVAVVWRVARAHVVGAYTLDVPPRALARGALHTVTAAAATGVMVTGMPLLFRVSLTDATLSTVAGLTLVVTLTRAPFIIPLMALQSFLTVSYRDDPARARSRMWLYLLFAALVAVAAAAAAWFAVPWLLQVLSDGAYSASPATSAVVVLSAVLVGCLCITGPALLARGDHRAYSAGWVTAAVVTLVALFLSPGGPEVRALAALVLAPVVGLIVHAVAAQRRPRASSSAGGE